MQNHHLPAISPVVRQLWMTLAIMVSVIAIGLGMARTGIPARFGVDPVGLQSVSGGIVSSDQAVRLATNSPAKAADEDLNPSAKPALVHAVVSRFSVDVSLAHAIVTHAMREAKASGLPVTLLLGVMARESSFNPKAISHHDVGLMQVNLKWHADEIKKAGGKFAMLRPSTNIRVGTKILQQYVASAGSIYAGLRNYNGKGKDNAYPDEVLAFKHQFDAALRA